MSIFGKILEKLGLKKEEEVKPEVKESPKTASAPKASSYGTSPEAGRQAAHQQRRFKEQVEAREAATAARASAAKVEPMAKVDVMSKLETMAKGTGLNWKQSIVDLLKVLGIDSSYEARKALAEELGCPAELMGDSAKMNTWLHKTVLQKIAENGGNIPKELLD
ncbi:MAG: DUF3597 domain-containing protein [Anaerolineae bacterium]|nr:MAG: DUF3597 domain-containing protein [Anaerolineae bacterium]